MKNLELIKGNTLRFIDPNCTATIMFADGDEEKTPELVMTAYSGGIIKGHWYWGDLAIDLDGLKIPNSKTPILEDHDTSKKIAFATKWSKEDNKLTVAKSSFVDTPESLSFRDLSGQGFPYEASIFARPEKILRLSEGEVATVNGFEMKGPGTIWRKCTLKEASICTFGYDVNTKSAALADEGEENIQVETESINPHEEEKQNMKKEQYKIDHEDEYNAIVQETTDTVTLSVTKTLEDGFDVVKTDLETKLADAVTANTSLTEENTAAEKRLLKLEQADSVRAKSDITAAAAAAFADKFKASGIPERLSEKIKRLVSHEKFVSEGVLDLVAFNAAIDTELAEWTADEDGLIQGFSTNRSVDDGNDDESAEADAVAARMLGHLGQKAKT